MVSGFLLVWVSSSHPKVTLTDSMAPTDQQEAGFSETWGHIGPGRERNAASAEVP